MPAIGAGVQPPKLTVGELRDAIKDLDPNMPVMIAMNAEYEWWAEDVEVFEGDVVARYEHIYKGPMLIIGDQA